jgi:stage V sporulation protein SpoVS
MPDKSAIQEAIERLLETLAQDLTPFGDEAAALAASSGIPAIDVLLPYADAAMPTPREIIAARWRFLDWLRDAMDEPQRDSGGHKAKPKPKARAKAKAKAKAKPKDKAKAAAEHLRAAAADLQVLGSDGLAKALRELAVLTEYYAHGSVIDVERLSSKPVEGSGLLALRQALPQPNPLSSGMREGTRLLATMRPRQLSADFTNKRGAESHRAELIRSVGSRLQAKTPARLITTLFRDVLGRQCRSSDVHQALGRQRKPAQVPSDADAALRAWKK